MGKAHTGYSSSGAPALAGESLAGSEGQSLSARHEAEPRRDSRIFRLPGGGFSGITFEYVKGDNLFFSQCSGY